jgi:hypothetical protein
MRFWTVDEARAYLPRLRELVAVVRDTAHTARRAQGNGHGQGDTPSTPAATVTPATVIEALEELEEGSIVVREPETGLVDFPARGEDGVVYFLCYRLGEPDLEWWHLPEDGFAGRRPLPRDPGAAE